MASRSRPSLCVRLLRQAVLCLAVAFLLQGQVFAQDAQKPVMENVFFNVVWGSAFGATLGVAVSVIGSDDKSAPDDVRSGAFSGATAGGLVGLGIALYMVFNGITLDAGASTFGASVDGPPELPVVKLEPPPFQLVTAANDPLKITGFTARVFELKF